jgi:hypothetical protein
MPNACGALLAARDEVPLALRATCPVESHSATYRWLARFRHRMTIRAAQVVAECPAGGTLDSLAELLVAGRIVLVAPHAELPLAQPVVRRRPRITPAEPLPEIPKVTSWISFQVVHHMTGEPYEGVRLVVRTPSGLEVSCRTDSAGMATLDEIIPGDCDVWCPLKDARLARTVAFVGMGKPVPRDAGGTAGSFRPGRRPSAEWIANIDEHQVQTGETLKSIADANGYSWQDLAEFNWGTRAPDEINRHLRDDVGCTVKTRDGFNYQFTSEDEPGLIYIPRQWSQSGLPTERTHVIRVRLAAGFRLILKNDDDLRIPLADYEVTLADGSLRKGRLGRGGVALIKDPPPGPVEVRYTDLDDVEAKSLAVTVRKAFDDRLPKEIHRLFRYPKETIQRAFKAYDQHFNDYHGQGLREDIRREWSTDDDAALVLHTYLADAELEDRGAQSSPQSDSATGPRSTPSAETPHG